MTNRHVQIRTGRNTYRESSAVERTITIEELIDQLEDIREQYGDDTKVIMRSYGDGAVYEPVDFADVIELDGDDVNNIW